MRVSIPIKGSDGLTLRFKVRPVRLVRERVAFYVEVAGPVEASGAGYEELITWILERVECIGAEFEPGELLELIGVDGLFELAGNIAAGGGAPPEAVEGMRKVLAIAHRTADFDPHHDPPCECNVCKGHAEYDPRCLFLFDRPATADIMAGWNWDLIAECWDLPWYVYQARFDVKQAITRGDAARYQETDRKRKEAEEAEEIRKRVLGTTDWTRI